jgi:large subunit ribosomal protein L3
MEARIRAWPKLDSEEPKILAHCGFKAGCIQIVSIDDREKTPNAGKQLVSLGTVLVTPPVLILGIRGYSKDHNGLHAEFDVYSEDIPKNIAKEITLKNKEGALENAEKRLGRIKEIFAIVAVSPRAAGLEQKKPYIFEALYLEKKLRLIKFLKRVQLLMLQQLPKAKDGKALFKDGV